MGPPTVRLTFMSIDPEAIAIATSGSGALFWCENPRSVLLVLNLRLSLRAAPYARLARRLVAGRGSLESVAYKTEILCPEETVAVPPAVFLPGQIEKVRDSREDDGWVQQQPASVEMVDATASQITSAATIAYHIRDCTIFDGSIYKDNFRYLLHPKADCSIFTTKPKVARDYNKGALASTYLGSGTSVTG